MPNLTAQQIQTLAQIAGLDIDDDRAETIAPRLQAVLDALHELGEKSADALASAEPAITFAPHEAADE